MCLVSYFLIIMFRRYENLNFILMLFLLLIRVRYGVGQTHAEVMAIYTDKLNSANYNTDVRPLKNQSEVIYVHATFELLSITEVNDVSQSFSCNGFLGLSWRDEIIAWDPDNYGGHLEIYPTSKKIWRPRVILLNTLDDRDLFEDGQTPTTVTYQGYTNWYPGSVFTTSCRLKMTNYPFDEQTCHIDLASMKHFANRLQFFTFAEDVGKDLFIPNGEWELLSVKLKVTNSTGYATSKIRISFNMKRNPAVLLMNVILPVVVLSGLNVLVFVIPAESGEKISFGITVLLASAVYLSIVSSMLPQTPTSMPMVTTYMFVLLMMSVVAVIVSIIIVVLHHKEEKEEKYLRAKQNYQNANSKLKSLRRSVKTYEKHALNSSSPKHPQLGIVDTVFAASETNHDDLLNEDGPKRNKYKFIGRYIDGVCFIVFLLIWVCVSAVFLTEIAS